SQYDAQQGTLATQQTAQQGDTARAIAAQQQITADEVAKIGASGQQQQDYVGKLSANIGMDVGGAAQLAAQTAQNQQTAQQVGAAKAGQAGQIGAGYEGLLQAMASANVLQKGQSASAISSKGQADTSELAGKRTDVIASKGPLATKYLADTRQQMFTNQLAAKNFNLDVQTQQTAAANAKALRDIQKGNLDVARQNANTRDRQVDADISQGLARIKISQQNADTNQAN